MKKLYGIEGETFEQLQLEYTYEKVEQHIKEKYKSLLEND